MVDNLDIVAIGDTVVDEFIKINVGHTELHNGESEYCIPFGSKIPYESLTVIPGVGNSANASVSCARLGLKVALVTFFGNDANGLECINRLRKEGVDISLATQEDGKKTNYHYVLWHGNERTILVKHEAFKSVLPDIGNPSWIYLSSLGSHTEDLHKQLAAYLVAHPNIKLAFQPGTFQLSLGKEKLSSLYERAEVLCVNKEEAMQLLEVSGEKEMKELLDGLKAFGAKIVLVSDGPNGAYMRDDSGYYFMPLYPDISPPLERTGSGDAFTSTFVAYLVKGMSTQEALLRAPINSMNVVQHIGAQEGLLTDMQIEGYLKRAPSGYEVKEILN